MKQESRWCAKLTQKAIGVLSIFKHTSIVMPPRGGFALVAVSALERAPPILTKDHVAKERKALKTGKLDEQAALVELRLADDTKEESDRTDPP